MKENHYAWIIANLSPLKPLYVSHCLCQWICCSSPNSSIKTSMEIRLLSTGRTWPAEGSVPCLSCHVSMGWVTSDSSLEALSSVSGIKHTHLCSEAYGEPVCSGDDVLLSAGDKKRLHISRKNKFIRCRKHKNAVRITSAFKSFLRQA